MSSSLRPNLASLATCCTISRSIICSPSLYVLPTYMKAAYIFGRCAPVRLYLVHLSVSRSLTQKSEKAFECWSCSLSKHFYSAITFVACIAAQSKGQRFLDHKIAKADPLHIAVYGGVQFLYAVLLVVLAHGTTVVTSLMRAYHSILSRSGIAPTWAHGRDTSGPHRG